MAPSAKHGLLVPLVAKAEHVQDVTNFLLTGYDLVHNEPETIQWFALKYESQPQETFAIFDAFATTAGRSAHLSGDIAAALMANAPKLLSTPPQIGEVDVLASKIQDVSDGGKTAGLSVGLRVLLQAKPDKVDVVREFLTGALPLVNDEAQTPIWYAIEYPGTTQFGIVDFFANEQGRDAHLHGKVAEALFSKADELLTTPPDVVKVNVIAGRIVA